MSEKTVKPEVQFIDVAPEPTEKTRRHLTAKYDRHQRRLINRRITLEDFVYDSIRNLYNCKEDDKDPDCIIDLDDVIKFETDEERSKYVKSLFVNCPAPPEAIQAFIDDFLKKLRTI